MARREIPNLIVCGTPGTGKTSLAHKLASQSGLKHIDLSKYAVEHNLVDGWDEVLNCAVLDEDKVVDHLESCLPDGGYILDYHGCDFFPQELIDTVVVLRTENSVLYDRLKARGYPEAKISNNMECEIFQTILDEARESYEEDIIMELSSNTPEEQDANAEKLVSWIADWKNDKLKK
ncbi:putative Adenylate kinase isoenzyme 6 [Hypsibius exemplaris]|uniref:Adenylate kinase isoenzyme 6 homolog n=1 Tax=Hypsibius exemplaris TaxID=2072580 RepID=A0A1W0XAI9_HYPEX|nr:putative Adenylate kinase isoenzyme 6 [Hypsibius exemplaris]